MTPPINSVSDEVLAELLAYEGDLYLSRAAQPHIRSILTELAARRAANTPVGGVAEAYRSALVTIAHSETETSFGDSRDLPASWYRDVARKALSTSAASPALPSQVVGAALTAYELQVLLGTSISGCNMEADRTFDLPAAWARLKALGLIDRADGLAIATDKGLARIQACLTSPAAEPVAWRGDHQVAGEYTRKFTAMKRVAEIWAEQGINVTPLYPAPSASREVTGAAAELIRRVRDVLDELGPGGYLLPAGAVKTNYLEAACNQMSALLAALPGREG